MVETLSPVSTSSSPRTISIALVGNPNTGKSTLFNRLTGSHQSVGNYPGVTVHKTVGQMTLPGRAVDVIDLPGTYSLAAASLDERVVVDVLTGRLDDTPRPDAIVCVVDATNLRRNLFLVSQIAETGLPVVVALNMIDAADRLGIRIDAALLGHRIGLPMVPVVAKDGRGMDDLRAAIGKALEETNAPVAVPWPSEVRLAIESVRSAARFATGVPPVDAAVMRMLFDTDPVRGANGTTGADGLAAAIEEARRHLREAGQDPVTVEAIERYRHIDALLDGVATKAEPALQARGYAIDRVLTHRVWGLLVFAGMMSVIFASIYWLASPLMDLVDLTFGALGMLLGGWLAPWPMLRSLVVDGMIAGVGGVIVFLPQILILFLFIGILEDSGYMARAAFLMDKVFAWCGLNGKSFVPMLSSFACAVPAIMSTRTIEDPKARLSTILVSPLISCSARLPVYVLMIGALIEPRYGMLWAGAALFAMHLLGLAVAIPMALFISRFLLHLKPMPFLLEMPPYRVPRFRDVGRRMLRSGRDFVLRAGTVIFAISILVWGLTYFPRPDSVRREVAAQAAAERGIPVAQAEALLDTDLSPHLRLAYMEQSYLGRAGRFVQPVFALAGFDWKITVGLLASFPAREVIVSTLGIVYNLSDEEAKAGADSPTLRKRLASTTWPDGRPVYTPIVALAVMVFFAFCMQCGSTVAIIGREAGWRWAAFTFFYMTVLAWVGAVATFQIGTAIWGA